MVQDRDTKGPSSCIYIYFVLYIILYHIVEFSFSSVEVDMIGLITLKPCIPFV